MTIPGVGIFPRRLVFDSVEEAGREIRSGDHLEQKGEKRKEKARARTDNCEINVGARLFLRAVKNNLYTLHRVTKRATDRRASSRDARSLPRDDTSVAMKYKFLAARIST